MKDAIQQVGFECHQAAGQALFHCLMANSYGDPSYLPTIRAMFAGAVAKIDALEAGTFAMPTPAPPPAHMETAE